MNNFGVFATSAIIALVSLVLCAPLDARADTVTLEIVTTGGQISGQDYVYPYDFSVDGSASLTPLMCISYSNDIYFGESWTAVTEPITTPAEEEAAYLLSVAENPASSAATIADAQWAAWEIFVPGAASDAPDQAGVNTMLGLAGTFANSPNNADFLSGFQLYVPVDGWPAGDGVPQTMIGGEPGAPEPSGCILLGTGLLGLAALLYWRKHPAR